LSVPLVILMTIVLSELLQQLNAALDLQSHLVNTHG